VVSAAAGGGAAVSATIRSQLQDVAGAFQSYKEAVGREDFTAAGQQLDDINRLLGNLTQELGQR